ncbi:MAG: hypothetical protein ACKVOQ_22055 [Cyclobacteriaceae bacterium]
MKSTVFPLSPLQLELLRVYSFEPDESELLEIKSMLGKYFAKRLTQLANEAVRTKNISEQELESWLSED